MHIGGGVVDARCTRTCGKREISHQGKDIVVFLTKYTGNELNAAALTDSD